MMAGIEHQRSGARGITPAAPDRGLSAAARPDDGGAKAARAKPPREAARPLSKVLVVEDEPQLTELLLAGLESEHTTTDTVSCGAEALAWLRQHRYDLVLLDLGLPDMDGKEILRWIKQDWASAQIPVVVITGREGLSEKLQAFELGATDYVNKPFALVELRARADGILRAKHLQDELRQTSQQLAARAELLAKTSHDVRNHLGAIASMTGFLFETDTDPQQREYLQAIRTNSESVLTLLNDILHYSKIEAGMMELQRKPFHLRVSLDEAMDTLATKAAEKGLDLLFEIEAGVPEEVVGDPNRLRQILVNLLGNAIKFTASGEVALQVGASELPGRNEPAEAGAPQGPEPGIREYHFSVRDTGIGIPADRLGRLFQPYRQADQAVDERYGGTGLGLCICKGLVELMGGRIWAESVEQRGTTIHFTLPLQAASHTLRTPVWQGRQPSIEGRRALIVDDNASTAALLARQFDRWGMRAVIARNGAEARERLCDGPAFDLALIDFGLGAGACAELAREIRRMPGRQHLPLVWLTPLGASPAALREADPDGKISVNKPLKLALLHSAVLRALAREPAEASPNGATRPSKDSHAHLSSAHPLRILLVDDDTTNRNVGALTLGRFGYRPDLATDGSEAVAAAQGRDYDLILMDVQMPRMNGLEAARQIRVHQARTGRRPARIVAMTAGATPGDRERCLDAGMDDCLVKPVTPQTLLNLLKRQAPPRVSEAQAPAIPGAPDAQPGSA